MDRLKVPFNGTWYEFAARSETGYDVTATDELIVKEMFVENVYQVHDGDLADTGVAMDIGGNIGAFSVFAAALGATQVHAFEPDSRNHEMLLHTIAANNMEHVIIPHHFGISGETQAARLVQAQGASFIVGTRTLTAEEQVRCAEAHVEDVHTMTLEDAFITCGVPYCDVLKVDCEGSEYPIFEAASPEVIAKARYITMEFHATDATTFGRLVAKLTLTHNIHIIGKHDKGGQIYAKRY